MVNLLNLTTAAAAASISILDHTQNFALDLVNGGCQSYTTVQQHSLASVSNQHWILSFAGPDQFLITNAGCGTTLTYAGSATSANSIRSQTVAINGSTTIWTVTPVNATEPDGAYRFIENSSGNALTAWANVPATDSTTAPLTLEQDRAADPRQQFFLVNPV
ncbi:hypothetical protein VKT23_010799 [Stygiomarasmius scandens]|uniref:Ricin B lectin domain-containing protein n=1 Tax=Marasmiellus scandens TaxID=2682957 RepID=A0ABR1JA64_9AGAR